MHQILFSVHIISSYLVFEDLRLLSLTCRDIRDILLEDCNVKESRKILSIRTVTEHLDGYMYVRYTSVQGRAYGRCKTTIGGMLSSTFSAWDDRIIYPVTQHRVMGSGPLLYSIDDNDVLRIEHPYHVTVNLRMIGITRDIDTPRTIRSFYRSGKNVVISFSGTSIDVSENGSNVTLVTDGGNCTKTFRNYRLRWEKNLEGTTTYLENGYVERVDNRGITTTRDDRGRLVSCTSIYWDTRYVYRDDRRIFLVGRLGSYHNVVTRGVDIIVSPHPFEGMSLVIEGTYDGYTFDSSVLVSKRRMIGFVDSEYSLYLMDIPKNYTYEYKIPGIVKDRSKDIIRGVDDLPKISICSKTSSWIRWKKYSNNKSRN